MVFHTRRGGGWIGAAVAAVVLLGACGSTSSTSRDSSSPSTSGSSGSTPASGKPIELSMVVSVSGAATYPASVEGAQVAVRAVNASGGVHGRPLSVHNCDDGNNPNNAAACARDIVNSAAVADIGAITRSGDSYLPILAAAGIADVGGSTTSASAATSPNSFQVDSGAAGNMMGAVRYLVSSGGKRVLIATSQSATARFIWTKLRGAYPSMSAEDLGTVMLSSGPGDLTPQAAQVKAANPDVIVVITAGQQVDQFLTALSSQGVDFAKTKVLLAGGFFGTSDIAALGPRADNLYVAAAMPPVSQTKNPGISRFLQEYKQFRGDLSVTVNELTVKSWATVHILAQIMEKLNTIDRASVMKALAEAGPITFSPVPTFDWSKPVLALGPRYFSDQVVVNQVQHGVITFVKGPFTIFGTER